MTLLQNVMFWLLIVLVIVVIPVIYMAYKSTSSILRPKNRRRPVTVFPDQFNLPFEPMRTFTADGVLLKGWFIPAPQVSNKTIIGLHGFGQNKGDVLAALNFLHDEGYNLTFFDFRNAGESEGNKSTIGYLEIKDLDAWLKHLRRTHPFEIDSLAVCGISMGASVAVYALAQKHQIKCGIIQSVFDSYKKVVKRWAWVNMRVPYFPLTWLTILFTRMKLGIDPEVYSPINMAPRINPGKHVLFVHGSHDNLAHIDDTKHLFDISGGQKEFLTIQGSKHAECAEVGGDEYKKKVKEFLKKYM